MEAWDLWEGCDSHPGFPDHGAVFLYPFAAEADVMTFDIHQSIVDRPDQEGIVYISSWVARVDSTLSADTDWMAVGARSSELTPTSLTCEGVVWAGKLEDTMYGWCGRSMLDDRVIQRRAFWGPSQAGGVGKVKTEAVHDLLRNGVAVGVGSVHGGSYSSGSQLILLTEACDLDGDQMVNGNDLRLFLHHWRQEESPCDLTGDGIAGDPDLKILLQAVGVTSAGRPALIHDMCEEYWAKTPPLPYVAAVTAFGFQDFAEFGDYTALLEQDEAVSLACAVTIVAEAMAGQ